MLGLQWLRKPFCDPDGHHQTLCLFSSHDHKPADDLHELLDEVYPGQCGGALVEISVGHKLPDIHVVQILLQHTLPNLRFCLWQMRQPGKRSTAAAVVQPLCHLSHTVQVAGEPGVFTQQEPPIQISGTAANSMLLNNLLVLVTHPMNTASSNYLSAACVLVAERWNESLVLAPYPQQITHSR